MSDAPTAAGVDGFVLLDKPAGLTSQRAVTAVKRVVGAAKAGHAGTLDPAATGLLVVGVGRGTRLLGYLSAADKCYEATIRFGQATTTDDAEGTPLGTPADATGLTAAAIADAAAAYTGVIDQVPSAVSAIKVDGRRAYDRVRRGEDVALAARTVTVRHIGIVATRVVPPWFEADVTVECSSGTYIRALARDLGRDLGVGAHLTGLRRTRVGGLDVADAAGLDTLGVWDVRDLYSMARLVAPLVEVDEAAAADVSHGRPLARTWPDDLVAVVAGGVVLGLYRRDPADPARARAVVVFPPGEPR